MNAFAFIILGLFIAQTARSEQALANQAAAIRAGHGSQIAKGRLLARLIKPGMHQHHLDLILGSSSKTFSFMWGFAARTTRYVDYSITIYWGSDGRVDQVIFKRAEGV